MKSWAPARHEPTGSATAEHFRLADLLLEDGRTTDAIMELSAARLELPPKHPAVVAYHERLGRLYLGQNDHAQAQENFEQAIEMAEGLGLTDARVADSHAGLGFCLMAHSLYHGAVESFDRALAMAPSGDMRKRVEKARALSLSRLSQDDSRDDFGPAFRVDRIVFLGNRTDRALLLRRMPFSEGSSIDARGLAAAKAALHRMNLFKSVEISTSPAASGGAEVLVSVRDGWYAVPFPVLSAGAGRRQGGLLLETRNALRKAETLTFSVLTGASGRRVALGGELERFDARFWRERRDFTERSYADGAFSASSGLGAPLDDADGGRYGPVAGAYQKRTDDAVFSVERALQGPWSAEAGFDRGTVGYGRPAPFVPGDAGRQGNAFAALKRGAFGRAAPGLGGLLGFGMAGLEERLKPLRRPRWATRGELRLVHGRSQTGSGVTYGSAQLRWQTTYSWGPHHSVSLAAAGMHGDGLPSNRLFATGRATALQGQYAREYRGRSAGGLSLAYSRRLRTTRLGAWQAVVFAEDAKAWFDRRGRDKQGLGAQFFYRFWRFPLPLGVGYTYSLDDLDSQVSAAVGGRF